MNAHDMSWAVPWHRRGTEVSGEPMAVLWECMKAHGTPWHAMGTAMTRHEKVE